MKAGQLRQRVVLQTQVTTQDAIGQPSTTWADTLTLWADVRYVSGLSAIKSGADVSMSKASIRLRYLAVNAGQRIRHGSVIYSIQAMLLDSRKGYVDLVCEVINAQS